MDPIKYIFEKLVLIERIAHWHMLLSEYNVQYAKQKVIKGSVLSKYLAHQPVEDYQPIRFDFLNEYIMALNDEKIIGDDEGPRPGSRWKLTFDGASNSLGHGIGVVITSPKGGYNPFTTSFFFDCTNNMAEYEACIMGIEVAIYLRMKILEVYRDSALVIYQVKG
ncbi:uncharacterized protein LOC127102894 [Lathyrus oleraceus]|uniref:uncharacterized protein LOC127102894 n=1 Tax=Pisum sativum TaxID=3888 RepID=UPI0021D28D9C|nr:uncharacterized protein LOC127102894 [Pisum sativum]